MIQWEQKQKGFTIVELLIVVVVIAILAAITIVSYNGITNQAHDSAVANDMKNYAKKIEMSKVTKGAYPFPLTKSLGISFSRGSYEDRNNLYYCINTTTDQFAIMAVSKSGRGYSYSSTAGSKEYTNGAGNVSGAATCALVDVTPWSTAYGTYAHDQTNKWNNTTWVN